ncbi:MAG: hypothetical protein FWF71_08035 [Actinomycetia bacterium]|nr:hypothetical protein [Actinomycetes bacterium]
MLGKILKYEFKATARIFVLLYAVLMVLAGINAALVATRDVINSEIYSSVVMGLTMIAYVLVAIAVFVVTAVLIVLRFYRMLGAEGYLWLTLPATTEQHILGKLVCGMVWSCASALIVIASIVVVVTPFGVNDQIWHAVSNLWNLLILTGFQPTFWLVAMIIMLLLGMLYGILMFYAAMAVGPTLVKSRLGGSVLAYVVFYVAIQVVGFIMMYVGMLPSAPILSANMDIPMSDSGVVSWAAMSAIAPGINQVTLAIIIISMAQCVLFAVAFYLITRYYMKRRLNLS